MDLRVFRQVWPDLPADDGFFSRCEEWKSIYAGAPPWANVTTKSIKRKYQRKMSQLGTAKLLCDEFAHKIFGEQVEISTGIDAYDDWIRDFLNREGFWKNMTQYLSRAFAVGGFCMKEYIGGGKVRLNFINGDNFYPTEWTGKDIVGGVFGAVTVKNKLYYTYLERHGFTDGHTTIERRLFRSSAEGTLGVEVPLDDLFELDDTPVTDVPMFQYYKPDIANNLNDLPLGISCFANCEDTLKALDVAFDSFAREFVLGRKRIIVPSSCIRTVVDPDTGKPERYFDTDDEVYQALKCDDDKDLKIQDNTTALRVEEHVRAINSLLNILCMQTGLSAGTFSFDMQQGMKTATEVISEESKTALTVKCHKNLLIESIEGMIRASLELAVQTGELRAEQYNLAVGFKDSIIIDDNQMIENNINLVAAGLKSKLTAIMEVMRCDEETAQKELERINAEAPVVGEMLM
jgi:A118 family predicted phage portal protein